MRTRSIFLRSMMLIMAGLLAVLAYLQYVWIGKLSESEQERMKAILQNSAQRFTEDFDQEITKLYRNFSDIDPLTNDAASILKRSAGNWQSSEFPQMLENIFLIIPQHKEIELQKWNPSTQRLESAKWNPDLEEVRKICDRERSEIAGEAFFVTAKGFPALLIPGARSRRELIPLEQSGWILLTLNRSGLQEKLLGSLAKKYFTGRGQALYDVAIVNQSEPNRLLLASSPNLNSQEMNSPDAVFDIFRLRLNNMLVEEVSVTSDQPKVLKKSESHEQKTVLIHRMTKDSPITQEKTIVEKDGRKTVRTLKMLPLKPGWKVLFKHKSASLEAVVNQVRRRNLLISFSILVLLATAVLLVLVEVRRTRNLAAQQMNFVAGVSHELRTPLSVICSAAENLSDAVVVDPKQVQKYGEMIRDEGRRLSEMIQQVLDFSGIQSDRKRERVWVPLQELVAKVVRDFSKIRPTAIETDLPMNLSPVFADQAAIESALMNLIDNACKYSGNTPTIRIEARESGNPKKVFLRVTDHGAGISPDDLPHIFEPFYRGISATSQRIRGTGLGLSLVKQVAESHGGGVAVESVEGKGSSFTFYFPANTDEVEKS